MRLLPGFDDVGWTIDLAGTKAFSSLGHFPGVYVNLRGRYEWGSVSPEEYENVRDELVSAISAIRTPDGEPLFGLVARREDVFDGPHVGRMPDVICEPNSHSYSLRAGLGVSRPLRETKRLRGTHAPDGMFLVKGPGIRPNRHVDGTGIQDMVPLVLFLMGLPQPSSADGKLPREVLDPGFFGGRQVSVVPVEELGLAPREYELDDSEQEAIRRELEGLGYL
jgi:predicted AlkP superfamily phosphohydrolase/phosphomutase